MQQFDLTLPTPAENLALDELLLECAEEGPPEREFLRLWEPASPVVVVGRSSRVEQEVDLDFCRRSGTPVLRRSSGGAAIVTGPGCLMYAVVLSIVKRPELKDITRAHAFVLRQLVATLRPLLSCSGRVTCAGTSDLAIEQVARSEIKNVAWSVGNEKCDSGSLPSAHRALRKFSGNSLRIKRTHLLYHGTLLYDFDLALIGKCLRTPPRQPEYRDGRSHGEFIANVPATRQELVEAVVAAFPLAYPPNEAEQTRIEPIVAERFENQQWNFEF